SGWPSTCSPATRCPPPTCSATRWSSSLRSCAWWSCSAACWWEWWAAWSASAARRSERSGARIATDEYEQDHEHGRLRTATATCTCTCTCTKRADSELVGLALLQDRQLLALERRHLLPDRLEVLRLAPVEVDRHVPLQLLQLRVERPRREMAGDLGQVLQLVR